MFLKNGIFGQHLTIGILHIKIQISSYSLKHPRPSGHAGPPLTYGNNYLECEMVCLYSVCVILSAAMEEQPVTSGNLCWSETQPSHHICGSHKIHVREYQYDVLEEATYKAFHGEMSSFNFFKLISLEENDF